tara:strand:- start:1476 stop:2171 length:696 start_codon:yes stop_codon:yes gene_type:complete
LPSAPKAPPGTAGVKPDTAEKPARKTPKISPSVKATASRKTLPPGFMEQYEQADPFKRKRMEAFMKRLPNKPRNRPRRRKPGMAEGGMIDPSADQATLLIEQTMMAVLGQLPEEEAEVIIVQFINEFGEEAFQMLREQALQAAVPGAQTEGMIQGPGGGMDDEVQGMIGSEQPVAVSPGEFIVPADVVSGLGDGSSDAGAAKLDGMMDEVRMAKTGGTMQPRRLSRRVTPS